MKLPITGWIQLRYSDERISLECAKEYLIKEMEGIRKEMQTVEELAIKPYLRNIILRKLDERKYFLNSLLKDVIYEINNLPKTT